MGPEVDLELHVTDVVNVLHFEDLRSVILVGHSYGGMVITWVADRAADRIGKLVFLDAANPVNGQSLVDVTGGMIEMTRGAGKTIDGVELVLFPGTDPLGFFGVTDPDDIDWIQDKLTPHPWACFEQKIDLVNEDALWAIPQYHIVCASTLAARDPARMAPAIADGRVWSIDTGHDLMITEPERVAEALVEVAAA